ncbi:MAG: hypothetical protein EBT13_07945 [Rhodobacteraceae bacterium]|nr:hypothetical protein [Paracoccaceae bacterium]
MDIAALAAELTAGHPSTGAYAADPQLAADQINAANQTRIKATISGSELFKATNKAEFAALPSAKQSAWRETCAIQEHDPAQGGITEATVLDIFPTQGATVAALAAARQETVSRAEVLGFGRVVAADIQRARGEIN